MRLMYCLMTMLVLGAACKKDKSDQELQSYDVNGPYAGVWVESSMQKDTLNFNAPKTMLEQLPWRPPSNAGVFIMGSEAFKAGDGSNKSPGGVYAYYLKNDSLYIYNYYNSSNYTGYEFKVDPTEKTITIGRFYERPGLSDELKFRQIR
ncbi:hypothetical protein [Pseudobacter ginsenosidimutans]|uniref:Lipocalin-like protein n=1 Tax=Pseudobacter ginsenosidimutans TaxID=661488 RepID=A0A4Q7MQA0_9BACT|nr:hypothetical protein [Pseudobacter ginsenosidimutans]QEC40481.1 hypothetical protein FSB84_01750 [Pseudobacter ginsenosidimutans]RZS68909.1 hypothetical protein EV199_4733 [Pseudobacter ginsenosidimutans]